MLALRIQQRIVLVPGITARVVWGVVVFDLLPEAPEPAIGYWGTRTLVAFVAVRVRGLISLGITVPAAALAPPMAVFAWMFLYLGASELVPRSYALSLRKRSTLTSIAGMLLMFAVASIAH